MSANPMVNGTRIDAAGNLYPPPRIEATQTCNTPVFRFQALLDRCQFGDWKFKVKSAPAGVIFLQIEFNAPCTTTGDSESWKSRKWQLSEHMTDSEVVQTAFKAVLTAQEHEAREKFKYRGRAIFGPHFNVERLWELCDTPDALQVRTPPPAAKPPSWDSVPLSAPKINPEVQARLEALYAKKKSEPEPEYSPWFPMTQDPPEPGLYQRRPNSLDAPAWSRWDGAFWYSRSFSQEIAEKEANQLTPWFVSKTGQWRGLAKDPNAVNGYSRGVWHDWEPGIDSKCPVPDNTIGTVRLRCGEEIVARQLITLTWRRMDAYWRANEIVAFKIDPLP